MYGKGGLCMQITDVRIRRVEKEGKMKAVVSITIENEFLLITRDEDRTSKANNELKEILGMDKLDRIELFDNSNLFGSFNLLPSGI